MKKLTYNFDKYGYLMVFIPNLGWHPCVRNNFRSFNGRRMVDGNEIFNGIYEHNTNKIVKDLTLYKNQVYKSQTKSKKTLSESMRKEEDLV